VGPDTSETFLHDSNNNNNELIYKCVYIL
jgi:hypothetical protein